jgi:phage/plasmid-like protein (TIGR03299 family)
MGHGLEKYDDMFSVHQVPWHGLGNVLTDYPTINEAKEQSGLNWTASIKPSFYEAEPGVFVRIQGANAVIRNDINIPIGTVGDRYEIYQNDEMWQFIETMQMISKGQLETAGSLRNGSTTWVLMTTGVSEYINGDPIENFSLFRNSFDGSSNIQILETNIRVVCHNTLSIALKGAKNVFNVRHTASAQEQLAEVEKALGLKEKHRMKFAELMAHLASFKLTSTQMNDFVENVVFPMPTKISQIGGEVVSVEEASKKAVTTRANKVEALKNLIETGAGTNIDGVKGTAYGLYQAIVEWTDHVKGLKVTKNRDRKEVAFENAFWGTGADFKQTTLDQLLKLAA